MSIAVEIAVQDVAGLEVAAAAGADRVELCADLAAGGVTPPTELVRACADRAAALVAAGDARPHFDVHVLIRCRAGEGDFLDRPEEFVYSADEVALMARQAAESVEAGAAGVVLGALTSAGELDIPALEEIRDAALAEAQRQMRGLTLTLHRAVDTLPDVEARRRAVTAACALGFHRVLSSGGAHCALDGADDLAAMAEAADGLLDICAGGGVRPADIAQLATVGRIDDVHLSARGRADGSGPTMTDPAIATAAVDAAGAL